MPMPQIIKIGNMVNVYWEYVESELLCRVLYVPQEAGDSWILHRQDDTVVYVKSFSKMVKVKDG